MFTGPAVEECCEHLGIEYGLWNAWKLGRQCEKGLPFCSEPQGLLKIMSELFCASLHKPNCAEIELNYTGDIQCLPHIYL